MTVTGCLLASDGEQATLITLDAMDCIQFSETRLGVWHEGLGEFAPLPLHELERVYQRSRPTYEELVDMIWSSKSSKSSL